MKTHWFSNAIALFKISLVCIGLCLPFSELQWYILHIQTEKGIKRILKIEIVQMNMHNSYSFFGNPTAQEYIVLSRPLSHCIIITVYRLFF